MRIEQVLIYAHTLIKSCTTEGDKAIDATVGNGFDTLFLSQLVTSSGKVYGFDIQQQAINNTKKLLDENHCQNVELYQLGHENINSVIFDKVSSAIFNLGYLPHGDKFITTIGENTIEAIKQILPILKLNGLIVLVVYHGHPHGKEEKEALLSYVSTLDQKHYQVLNYQFINQKNDAPFLIAIEKISEEINI